METALELGGADFAAGERHSLENPLVPECRILILLFPRTGALARIFLFVVPVPFNHKNDLNPHKRSANRRDHNHFFRQAYNKNSIKPIAWLVRAKRRPAPHPQVGGTTPSATLEEEKMRDRALSDDKNGADERT